jgi:hypothetical protein
VTETYRYPPERQPPEHRELDERGSLVLTGHDPAAGVIARNPDGTETLRPPSRLASYPTPLAVSRPERDISSDLVMRLAVHGLLMGLVCYQVDHAALLSGAPAGVRPFALQRVHLSWPRPSEEPEPAPSVLIVVEDDVTYSDRQRHPYMIDGSRGRWAPNTVLRKVARATGQVQIQAWCANIEQQEALRSAIERAFLAEPSEDLISRRIVVPQYFDQQARLTLMRIGSATSDEMVRENRWPLVATVQVEIDRVILMQTPPTMESLVGSDVGGEVTITT